MRASLITSCKEEAHVSMRQHTPAYVSFVARLIDHRLQTRNTQFASFTDAEVQKLTLRNTHNYKRRNRYFTGTKVQTLTQKEEG